MKESRVVWKSWSISVLAALTFMCVLFGPSGLLSLRVLLASIYSIYIAVLWIFCFLNGSSVSGPAGHYSYRVAYRDGKRWNKFLAWAGVGAFLIFFWKLTLVVFGAIVLISALIAYIASRHDRRLMRHHRYDSPDGGGSAPALVPAGPISPRRTGSEAKRWPAANRE
ncbi:MAG TPA: hypothetical protein VGL56_10085 [Fimbriimonadaceae bacterium]